MEGGGKVVGGTLNGHDDHRITKICFESQKYRINRLNEIQ